MFRDGFTWLINLGVNPFSESSQMIKDYLAEDGLGYAQDARHNSLSRHIPVEHIVGIMAAVKDSTVI